MIERFSLTLKQECVWLHRFESRDHAFRVIADWLDRYDADRPHSALGYLTPQEYREKLADTQSLAAAKHWQEPVTRIVYAAADFHQRHPAARRWCC